MNTHAPSGSDTVEKSASPNSSVVPENSLATVSRPNKLGFAFDEFMAILSGLPINQLLTDAERNNQAERVKTLRNARQLFAQQACYLNGEPMRQRYEIAYIKLSVFQRILASMRESQRILGLPIDVQQLDITAEWATASAIVPLFWNYRIMTVPAQKSLEDNNASFSNDAYHFGLLLAESLLCNTHYDKVLIRERVVTQSVSLNGRFRVQKDSNVDAVKLEVNLRKIFEQREFSICNLIFDSDYSQDDSRHVQLWFDTLVFIFKLTTRIKGFSYYHSSNEQNAQIATMIGEDLGRLTQAYKQKMFEPVQADLSIAKLLDSILPA